MGQQRLAKAKADDLSKRPKKASNNTVLNSTNTKKGDVFRAQRRINESVNLKASQHIINIPVNKSIYNGYDGQQFSLSKQKLIDRSNKNSGPKLRVIPIGGLGEMGIGKNMMAIEYGDETIVIDCGFLFPGDDYPGINYIVPDITYLEENKHKIKAHIFTHAHLDHIGAFRHLASKIPVPVYATRFTINMLKKNLDESDGDYEPAYREVNPEKREKIQIGNNFSIEFYRVAHSIPDCAGIIIRTPLGVLIHTGDWRFEDQPVDGKKVDIERISEVASKEGVLLLMNESTNCESEGSHMHSEYDIQASIGQIMDKFTNSRIVVSCFSSHLHRIQLILDEAKQHGRKVAFSGYSMIQNLEVAIRSGVIKIPKDVVMKMDDIVKLDDSKVTVICTGSQGELTAVLSRMINGSHKHIKIKRSDIIVFSSNPIPGNEKFVARTVDGLMREGSEVIQNKKTHLTGVGPLHLSGHAYYDDHVKMISAINPTYYMPIHGEFHMLAHNAEIAEKIVGLKKNNIFVCDAGDILEIDNQGARKAGRVNVGGIMYDDSGEIVSEVVLKDRIHMATEGMFIVVLTIQRGNGRLLTSPDIISRGFIYLRDSEELMGMIRQYLKQKVARSFSNRHVDIDNFKKEIKDDITYILYDQTKRNPIVIPVINEVGSAPNKSQAGGNPRTNNNKSNKVPSMNQNNINFKNASKKSAGREY